MFKYDWLKKTSLDNTPRLYMHFLQEEESLSDQYSCLTNVTMRKRREEGLWLGRLSKPHNTHISPISIRCESELLYGRWVRLMMSCTSTKLAQTPSTAWRHDCWESRWALRFGFGFTVTTCPKKVALSATSRQVFTINRLVMVHIWALGCRLRPEGGKNNLIMICYLFIIQKRRRYFKNIWSVEEKAAFIAPPWNTDKFQRFTCFMYY